MNLLWQKLLFNNFINGIKALVSFVVQLWPFLCRAMLHSQERTLSRERSFAWQKEGQNWTSLSTTYLANEVFQVVMQTEHDRWKTRQLWKARKSVRFSWQVLAHPVHSVVFRPSLTWMTWYLSTSSTRTPRPRKKESTTRTTPRANRKPIKYRLNFLLLTI